MTSVQGDFILPKQRPERFIFIAGGSGITPIRALTDALLAEDYLGQVDILYYVPTKVDAIFLSHFQTMAALSENFRFHLVTTREQEGGDTLQGHFSESHLDAIGADLEKSQAYVCGPTALIAAVESFWQQKNQSQRLIQEYFKSAPIFEATVGDAQPVYFSDSQVTSSAEGKTILEVAEGAGLEPMHGCRQGICRTCTCRKTSGQVKNLRTGEISDAGEEDIAICISVPVTPVTLEL
jgi:ferredoxin-NADP reductase